MQRARLVLRERLGRVRYSARAEIAGERVEHGQVERQRLAARGAGGDDRVALVGRRQRVGLVGVEALDAGAQGVAEVGVQRLGQRLGRASWARTSIAATSCSRRPARAAPPRASARTVATSCDSTRGETCPCAASTPTSTAPCWERALALPRRQGEFTLRPARALEACHRAGVEVVIKSGRRKAQVMEDARLMGQTAYIYEVGWGLVIDGEETLLTGPSHRRTSVARTS